MTPHERLLGRVRNHCFHFHRIHGTDAHRPDGLRTRAALWELTDRYPSRANLEEVLAEFAERIRIKSNNVPLSDGEREVWPNESDYSATKNLCLQVQDQIITDKIQTLLLGDKTP